MWKKKQEKIKNDEIELSDNVADLHDLFIPDGLLETKDYLYLGPENYVRTFVVSVYPREIYVGWLDDLFSIEGVSLTTYIEPVPDDKVAKNLKKKLDSVLTEIYSREKNGDITNMPELTTMRDDLLSELTAVQTNRDKMFYITIFLRLRAKNEEDLENKTYLLESLLARKATYLRSLTFRQIEGFKSVLPTGNIYVTDFKRNVTTGGVAAMFPISNPDMTHNDGIPLGKNLFTRSPVFMNNFAVPDRLNNQHIAIFGIPGSGKSVALKHMLAQYVIQGKKVVVVDPEGEYKKLINDMLEGEYITIKSGTPTGINLFDLEIDLDEYGRETVDLMTKVAEIRGILGAISRNFNGRPLNALEIVAIEQAVLELYNERDIRDGEPESLYQEGGIQDGDKFILGKVKKRMPTLSEFQAKLSKKKNAQELSEILIPFLKGGSMGLFDCETSIDLKSHIIGFNFFDIKDEFTKFYATYVLLSWIWQNFVQRQRDVDKIVANDETWMFVKYPEAALFLNDLARRGRKHHASLIVASQFIDEFLSNEEGRAVIKSCATVMLMRQHPSAVDQVTEFFSLSEGTKNLLETFNPGECILSLNGNVTAVAVEPTSYEWPYITT